MWSTSSQCGAGGDKEFIPSSLAMTSQKGCADYHTPTRAGEVPYYLSPGQGAPFSSHLRCFCIRHYTPREVLISASPCNHSITVLSCCVTSFQEGQRIVAVRMKVAVARMSCDDAPTRTSNSPASATQLWVESS